MLFVIVGLDRPKDGAALRRATRATHLEFLTRNPGIVRNGGALRAEDGSMAGSLMIVDVPDRAALDRFLAEEPYCRSGLYEPRIVMPYREVIPEPTPGFLAKELAGEAAKAGAAPR